MHGSLLVVPITAIVCVAILEAHALARGIDGTELGVAIAATAGVGGYAARYVHEPPGASARGRPRGNIGEN